MNDKKIVLIVDDDEKNMRVARDILMANGYGCLEAKNGKEGLDIALAEIPDLILMDYDMPVMDGMEATKLIKAENRIKNIPCIMLTASAMAGDREKMLSAGCCDYISKPLNLKELLMIIRKYLTNGTQS